MQVSPGSIALLFAIIFDSVFLFSMPSALAREFPDGALNPSTTQYLKDVWPLYNQTSRAAEIFRSYEAQKFQQLEAARESPFVLSSSISRDMAQKDLNLDVDAFQSKASTLLTNNLVYGTRRGLEVSLNTTYGWEDYYPAQALDANTGLPVTFEPNSVLSGAARSPYDISLKFAYDFTRGGESGVSESLARAKQNEAIAGYYEVLQNGLQNKIDYASLWFDAFSSSCKLEYIQKLSSKISDLVKNGRLQLKVKTISQKDFLNFRNLESAFFSKLAQIEAEKLSLDQTSFEWGPPVAEYFQKSKPSNCQLNLSIAAEKIKKNLLSREEAEKLGAALPASLRASLLVSSSRNQLVAKEKEFIPSLKPFGTIQNSRSSGKSNSINSYGVGVSLEWTIPSSKTSYGRDFLATRQASAERGRERTLASNLSFLLKLNNRLETHSRILELLQKNLDTSEELLSTLRNLYAIGHVDSLNLTNAYLDQISIYQSLMDTWMEAEKTFVQLNLYRKTAANVVQGGGPWTP